MPTTTEFLRALRAMPAPSPKMQRLLRAHAKAPHGVSIARNLARDAGYKNWRGMNLQYGLLGKRIARKLGVSPAGLALLAEFIRPGDVKNKEWLLLMKPEFATAVKRASWF
jgi:hypothetical protein